MICRIAFGRSDDVGDGIITEALWKDPFLAAV